MKDKLTLGFNYYEAEQLNKLQISYLFGKAWYSLVPSINDILKGMVTYSLFETSDKRVLKGFINNFLKKRNLPPNDEEADSDNSESNIPDFNRISTEVNMPAPKFIRPKSGNYTFYFEDRELEQIETLKKRISENSSVPFDSISKPEVVRECIHLVLDKRSRNLDFRYTTYIGFLYGFSPSVSVIVGQSLRRTIEPNEIVRSLADDLEKDEEILKNLLKIERDKVIFQSFKEAFLKYWQLDVVDDINQVVYEYESEVTGFDFYMAFLGAELLFYSHKQYVNELPDFALYLILNKGKERLGIGLDLFESYLEIYFTISEAINDTKMPKTKQTYREWSKSLSD